MEDSKEGSVSVSGTGDRPTGGARTKTNPRSRKSVSSSSPSPSPSSSSPPPPPSVDGESGVDGDSVSASAKDSTAVGGPVFDFSAYPENTLFHERRRRTNNVGPRARKPRPERRKRVDPCTFEKQYTAEETEFMNAMQQFKDQSGKAFPTFGEVLRVARALGYRKTGPAGPIPGGPSEGS